MGEFLFRERIVCKLFDLECFVVELVEEINDLKYRFSIFFLCFKKVFFVDELCFVDFIKELKIYLCDDVKFILLIDGVILFLIIL